MSKLLALLAVALMAVMAYYLGYTNGNTNGWQECIEENNLYERYK